MSSPRALQTVRDSAPGVRRALRLRPMLAADITAAMVIEEAVQPQPWTATLMAVELSEPTRTYLAAEDDDGQLIGFAGVMVAAEEAHIINIATHPERQRQGVAGLLLRGLLEAAIAAGARSATLEVRVSNGVAQRLYRRHGFAPVGLRPGYYAPTGEDAVIMWAHDIDHPAFAVRLALQPVGPDQAERGAG